MKHNVGVLQVSFNVLEKFMGCPPDIKFLRVRQSWEQERQGVFEVLVEAPSLQEVPEGNKIPWIRGVLTAQFCTQDEITHLKDFKVENY